MAELVDAQDSKSCMGNHVGVRFPLPAPAFAKPACRQTGLRLAFSQPGSGLCVTSKKHNGLSEFDEIALKTK